MPHQSDMKRKDMTTNQNRGHTPEPWITEEESGLMGQGKILITTQARKDKHLVEIGEVSVGYDEFFDAEQEANARRIVACVNACAGTSTEWLEGYASVIKVGDPISKNFDYLREQRDALQLRVTSLEGVLKAAQFGPDGKCPVCAGWNMSDWGETARVHTPTCPVGLALSPSGPQEA